MINTLFKTSKCLFTQLKPDGSSFYPSQDSDQGRQNKKNERVLCTHISRCKIGISEIAR